MGHDWKPWERARKNGLTGKGGREYAAVVMSGAGDVCMSVEDVEGSDELGVTEPDRKRNCVGGRKGKVDQDAVFEDSSQHKRPSTRQQQTQTRYGHTCHKDVIQSQALLTLPVVLRCNESCRECCSQRVSTTEDFANRISLRASLRQPIMRGLRRPRSSSVTDSFTALIG